MQFVSLDHKMGECTCGLDGAQATCQVPGISARSQTSPHRVQVNVMAMVDGGWPSRRSVRRNFDLLMGL